jgi:hypothetical protein
MASGKPIPKKKSSIGVKASAAEAGKYTREAGVLAYYEVNFGLHKFRSGSSSQSY